MPKFRPAAATTAATVALALAMTAAPAHAAELGNIDDNKQCAVTFTAAEKNFLRTLFHDSKKIGDFERARDQVAAVDAVFPGAKNTADRDALAKLGLPAPLIDAHVKALTTTKTAKPTTATSKDDIDTENFKVAADATGADSFPSYDTVFPLSSTTGISKELHTKLTAAWVGTQTGDVTKRSNDYATSLRLAQQACALETSKVIAFPEQQLPAPSVDLSSMSSQSGESNFDLIIGGIITVVVALIGLVAALPQLGINLPFDIKL